MVNLRSTIIKLKTMKRFIFIISVIPFFFISCVDNEDVDMPSFNVNTEKNVYKVNEEVQFNFDGSPDYLVFFSGEDGYRYDYIDRTSESGSPSLSFNSKRSTGNQENTLFLMISSDFNGTMDYENVMKANWTDLTSRAKWPIGTNANNVASGSIDLSEFKGNPVYIAFKYVGYAGSAQRRWDLSSVVLTNKVDTDKSAYKIWENALSPRFFSVFTPDTCQVGWKTPATTLTAQGYSYADNIYNEHWLISSPVDLDSFKPDVGVSIKSQSSNMPLFYSYQYKLPGTYKVTFLAKNITIGQSKEIIREIELTIEK